MIEVFKAIYSKVSPNEAVRVLLVGKDSAGKTVGSPGADKSVSQSSG